MGLIDRVGKTIHLHIQSHIEEVLVDDGTQLRRNERTILRLLVRLRGTGVHDARQFHLKTDGAILRKGPVEPVIIDTNGRNEGDDEPTRAAYLSMSSTEIGMFPQQSSIFFMQANGIG